MDGTPNHHKPKRNNSTKVIRIGLEIPAFAAALLIADAMGADHWWQYLLALLAARVVLVTLAVAVLLLVPEP